MSDPFVGMTLDLSVGSIDLLDGRTLVYEDTNWTCYENFAVFGDLIFKAGFRENKNTGVLKFVIVANYGHRGSTKSAPDRIDVDATLTWTAGGGGSQAVIVDKPPTPFNVLSGQSIPPVVIDWDSGTQVATVVYEGYSDAFVQTSMFVQATGQSGVTDRFSFRFDPAREVTTYERMMRGFCYGASWLNTDGTTYRADTVGKFHCGDYTAWLHTGQSGDWWLQTNIPATTANWRFYPGNQHADSGSGPFALCFEAGGEEFWTDPAWQIGLKKQAASWLQANPSPYSGGYANVWYLNYHQDAVRMQGRIIGMGVLNYRALLKLALVRPSDPDLTPMIADTLQRVLDIFDLVYTYSKPDALPGDPPVPLNVGGFWARIQEIPNGHPDRGGALPANQPLLDYQPYQGGLLWQGLYHMWNALGEFGQGGTRVHERVRHLMDFIAIGKGRFPGLYQLTHKFKGSHPYPPPSSLPPAWAKNSKCASTICPRQKYDRCWPDACNLTVSGFGWSNLYYEMVAPGDIPMSWDTRTRTYIGNWNNDDLKYLSGVSESTSTQSLPVFEFIDRQGMMPGTKIDEIVADYTAKRNDYRWSLGPKSSNPLVVVVNEGSDITDTTVPNLSLLVGTLTQKVLDEPFIDTTETVVVSVLTNTLSVVITSEDTAVSDSVVRDSIFTRVWNIASETTEVVHYVNTAGRVWNVVLNDTVQTGEEGVDEIVVRLTSRAEVNVGRTLGGTSISVGATLQGKTGY